MSRESIIETMAKALDGLSSEAKIKTASHCQQCGSRMHFMDGIFSFWDDNRSWQIPVPFCPQCQPETNPLALKAA